MKIQKAVIHTDGGAEPNPGPAAIGVTIKDEHGKLIASIGKAIGHATNNQAEYRAVIAALEKAARLGVTHVDMRSDSELLVRQINGVYRVRNADLKPLYEKVKQLQSRMTKFTMSHIPRELNAEADALAGKALR